MSKQVTTPEENLLDEMYQFIKDMGFTRKETVKSWRAKLMDEYAQIRKICVHKERSHG